MPTPPAITTIDELHSLPEDGLRHELLEGRHVMTPAPSPRHQRVVGELGDMLRSAVRNHPLVEVLAAPADIALSEHTLVQPDLFIVSSEPGNRFERWNDAPTPLITIEVLSPTTAARDRIFKRRLYLSAKIEEYWIIDPDAEVLERWRTGSERPEILDGQFSWHLSNGVSGEFSLRALFERVNG